MGRRGPAGAKTSRCRGLLQAWPHWLSHCCGHGVKSRSALYLRTNSEFSETSDIFYSLSCSSSDLSSLFRFRSSLLILSVRPFPIFTRLLTMLTQCHVPAIAPPPELRTRSSSRTLIPVPAPPLDSELLLYLNPLYLAIQPNLIITLHCVTYVTFHVSFWHLIPSD